MMLPVCLFIFYLFFVVVHVAVTCFITVVIMSTKSLRKIPTNIIIVSFTLAFTVLNTAKQMTFLVDFLVFRKNNSFHFRELAYLQTSKAILCLVYIGLQNFNWLFLYGQMMLLAWDRFKAVSAPLKYIQRKAASIKATSVNLAFSLLFSMLVTYLASDSILVSYCNSCAKSVQFPKTLNVSASHNLKTSIPFDKAHSVNSSCSVKLNLAKGDTRLYSNILQVSFLLLSYLTSISIYMLFSIKLLSQLKHKTAKKAKEPTTVVRLSRNANLLNVMKQWHALFLIVTAVRDYRRGKNRFHSFSISYLLNVTLVTKPRLRFVSAGASAY